MLLLSLAWGLSVLVGRCDLGPAGTALDKRLTRGFWDLSRTGVTVDPDVRRGAVVMAGSVLLYGTVQVPTILGNSASPQARSSRGGCCLLVVHVVCGGEGGGVAAARPRD